MADTIYSGGPNTVGTYTHGTSGNDVMKALAGGGQLDGGSGNDQLNGSSGSDLLVGGKDNDFMYGGAGADTFQWDVSHIGESDGTYDKVFDFEGAGVGGGDSLVFQHFSVGSTLTQVGVTNVWGSEAKTFTYELKDAATGFYQLIYVTSKNGLALTSDDYHFYGTTGSPT